MDQRSGLHKLGRKHCLLPWEINGKGFTLYLSELTGGKAISLNYMALWYKEWLYKSR